MKKIITTILALGLATTLMGCSKSETKQVDDVAWQTVIVSRNTKRWRILGGYYQMMQS